MKWSEKVLVTIPDVHVQGVVSLMHTSREYDKLLAKLVKPFDLSFEQFSVLKILQVVHPNHYSLKEIQSRLINQTANTTRLVEKLRQKNLINCTPNPDNRRQLNIAITTKGLKLAATADGVLAPITENLKSAVSEKEMKTLIKLCKKIQTIF